MARPKSKAPSDSAATLGFDAKLWLSADTSTRVSAKPECAATWRDLRGAQDHRHNNMDAAEYKHVVLGLTWRVFCAAKDNSSPTRPSATPTGSARTTTCAGCSASL